MLVSWNSQTSRPGDAARDPRNSDHLAKLTGIGFKLGIARS
jgi:hypothetical protein